SSRASIERTGHGMTLPALVVGYSGDHGIFPSDTDLIATSIAAPRVDRIEIDADHYGFPSGREDAVAAIADWIDATAGVRRGRPRWTGSGTSRRSAPLRRGRLRRARLRIRPPLREATRPTGARSWRRARRR